MHREPASLLRKRAALTDQLGQSPYNAETYLERALFHEELGFPDLAAGDAYRALLLTDDILDESGEYHVLATEAIAKAHHIPGGGHERNGEDEQHSGSDTRDDASDGDSTSIHSNGKKPTRRSPGDEIDKSLIEDIARHCARRSFVVLTRTLSRCGCLRSAFDFSDRGLKTFPNYLRLKQLQDKILDNYHRDRDQQQTKDFDPKTDLPESGSVRRELYPWNKHEPDRFSSYSLSFLNSGMRKVAPKCEVRAVALPILTEQRPEKREKSPLKTALQLGIFATEDIAPRETVLHESSILTANNRLHEPLCDACSAPLPDISSADDPLPSCPSCDDTVFCSQACLNAAQSFYHPAVCGKPDFDILARDPSPAAASNALYLVLLARTFALSETQNIHPLELPETKYLWGDFVPSEATYSHSASASAFSTARHLPFTFDDNIAGPLHFLEKMDINIFTSLANCDTWILNTLYAKFRATASARLNPKDGGPEVCAVHPNWCLANHSCAPNVEWEWGGEIRFVARDEAEVEKWQGMGGREWGKGIMKGEEILNHYCDVGLGLKERREWAAGALGGICACERCLWEEGKEKREGKGGENRK